MYRELRLPRSAGLLSGYIKNVAMNSSAPVGTTQGQDKQQFFVTISKTCFSCLFSSVSHILLIFIPLYQVNLAKKTTL